MLEITQTTPAEDQTSEAEFQPAALPSHWTGKDFYLLGIQLEEGTGKSPPEVDLSQHDFEATRSIWIVIGDNALSLLPEIHRRLHKRSRVLVMIHPEVLDDVQWSKLFFLASDERFFFVPMQEVTQQARAINSLMDENAYDGWRPVMTFMSTVEWVQHYRELIKALTPLLNRKLVGKATLRSASHQILCNALINFPLTSSRNRWDDYRNLYADKPALIISTGPSLNKQLALIEQYKDHFVTIAVDPAVPILQQRGVVPDFVLTIDPKKRPYWKQNALDERTTFVVEVGACPDGAWSHANHYLMTAGHSHVYSLLKKLGTEVAWIETGGSVSSNGFSLAMHLGCNPIVLVGQDLAWTEGKDHAEGYTSQYSQEELKKRRDRGYDIVGYGGQMVRTEPQLLFYKSWFEQKIQQCPHKTVINATEGGAIIEGALAQPFRSVCKDMEEIGVVQKHTGLTQSFELDLDLIAHFEGQLQHWITLYADLKARIQDVQKKIQDIKKTPKKSVQKLVKQINRSILDMEPEAKLILEMFSNLAMVDMDRKMDKLDDAQNLKTVYSAYNDLYDSVTYGLKYGLETLPKIIDLLHLLSVQPTISRRSLIAANLHRWNLDGTANQNFR